MPQLIPIENKAQRLTFGIQVTFAVVSTTAVTLRLVARKQKGLQFQWDDYLIAIALVGHFENLEGIRASGRLTTFHRCCVWA